MRKIISIILIFAIICSVGLFPASASDVYDNADIDYTTNAITVSATLENVAEATEITLLVLEPNVSAGSVEAMSTDDFEEAVPYSIQLTTDEEGSFSHSFVFNNDIGGDYSFAVVRMDDQLVYGLSETVRYYSEAEKLSILGEFSLAEDYTDVTELLEVYHEIFGIESLDMENIDDISNYIMQEAKINPFENASDLKTAYIMAAYMEELKAAATVDEFEQVITDNGLTEIFTELSAYNTFSGEYLSDTDRENVGEFVVSTPAEHISDYQNAFTEKTILIAVDNMEEGNSLDSVVMANKDYLSDSGLALENYENVREADDFSSVGNSVAGNTYETIALLCEAINAAVNNIEIILPGDVATIGCNIDYITNTITVSAALGGVAGVTDVTLLMLKPNVNADSVETMTISEFEESVPYSIQLTTNEDGKFSHSFVFNNGACGTYSFVVVRMDNQFVCDLSETIDYYCQSKKIDVLNRFSLVEDYTDVTDLLEEYHEIFGIESLDMENIDNISKYIMKEASIRPFESGIDLRNAYIMAACMKELQEANTVEAFEQIIIDNDLEDLFTKIPAYKAFKDNLTDADRAAVGEYVVNAPAEHISDYQEAFTEKTVLIAVSNMTNYSYLDSVVMANKEFLSDNGLNLSDYEKVRKRSSFSSVGNSVAGNTYETIALLCEAINTAVSEVKPQKGDSGGSGGGSGGSSGGGSGGDNFSPGTIAPVDTDEEGSENEIQSDKQPFVDMGNTMWAAEAVGTLRDMGVISGKSETRFAPNDMVKREEFIKMIVLGFNLPETNEKVLFSDASENDWFYPYLNRGYSAGIVNGLGDGSFGSGKNISREDMAVLLCRILERKKALNMVESKFKDNDAISSYAKDSVNKLSAANIITGMDDGSFLPKQNATRAQAAVMIYRAMQYGGVLK